ncbi:VanZ family protein [candidate division WOR-3 bacterium]|nr:VanZ family protein [candidate division WOR-3 bacterium]
MNKKYYYTLRWAFVVVLVLLPLLPSSQNGRIELGALFNTMHFFLTGTATFLIAGSRPGRKRMFLAFVIPVAASCAVELLQLAYPERSAGIDDIIRSALGSICALVIIKGRKRFFFGAVFSLILFYAAAYDLTSLKIRRDIMVSRFPVLDDIHAPSYTRAWKPRRRAELRRQDGEMIFTALPDDKWSNIESNILPRDWSDFKFLSVEAKSSNRTKCGIQLRTDKGVFYGEFTIDTFYERHDIAFEEFRSGENFIEPGFNVELISVFLSKPAQETRINIKRIKLL